MRRVSVNERSSLYRREHRKEAMVWQERGRQDDDEDRQTDHELHLHAMVRTPTGRINPPMDRINGGSFA